MKYVEDEKNKFISLKVIIDRVMTNPGAEDLPYDIAVTTTSNIISQLINPTFLITENDYIDVSDYRAELPHNCVDVVTIMEVNENKEENTRKTLLINQDPFFMSYAGRDLQHVKLQSNKYRIQGDYIYTTFETGKLHIAYTTIPTDFEGVVMIPDRVSIVKAIEFGILNEWFRRKFFANKITGDKVSWTDKEANWYLAQASSDFAMENLDRRRTLSNIMTTLLTNIEHDRYEFNYLGDKEYKKLHI